MNPTCPICHKEFKNKVGLFGHLRGPCGKKVIGPETEAVEDAEMKEKAVPQEIVHHSRGDYEAVSTKEGNIVRRKDGTLIGHYKDYESAAKAADNFSRFR